MSTELTIYRHEAKSRAEWQFILTTGRLRVAFAQIGEAARAASAAMTQFGRRVRAAQRAAAKARAAAQARRQA